MQSLSAIVTGAAKGIGKAIAGRLIADGFSLILIDTDDGEGEKVAGELGSGAQFFCCDISSEDEVQRFYGSLGDRQVDVLVNNAGIIRDNVIWKMSADEFDTVLDVNLKGSWLMCREAARIMKAQQCGRIVNIASRAWLGNPGQSNYAASKAGIVALTRVLALELGKYNVCVNAIAPGLIDSPLTQKLPHDVLQKLIQAQPSKSIGTPEDVAHAVSFLASPYTKFITGQTLYVDGGKSIGANMI